MTVEEVKNLKIGDKIKPLRDVRADECEVVGINDDNILVKDKMYQFNISHWVAHYYWTKQSNPSIIDLI